MASFEDILKSKKVKKEFVPEKRRAWDYMNDPENGNNNRNDNKDNIGTKIGTDVGTNIGTNGNEIGNENRNNWEQISEQSRNESSNKDRNIKGDANRNDDAFILKALKQLTGHQKAIMAYVGDYFKRELLTEYVLEINIDHIAKEAATDKEIVRTSLKRLYKKSILIKLTGERGRNGCTKVKVPEFIAKECFYLFSDNGNNNRNEYRNINRYENGNPIYSSSNNIKTTTTDLPEEWKNIDCEPLAEIGFCAEHLKQLVKFSSPEVVQQSINHLAFQLEKENIPNPLNQLMGTLRRGGAWFVAAYRSKQERALEETLKARKEEQERVAKMEAELLELNFNEWLSKLTEEQQKALVSPASWNLAPAKKNELKKYYIENVYKK